MNKAAILHKFGTSTKYLKSNFVIRLRKVVLGEMLPSAKNFNIIDVACGNAEISMQYLSEAASLHLVDISDSMIREAIKEAPPIYKEKIFTAIYDFELENYDHGYSKYDLVICTGLFAHVQSPEIILNKLVDLVTAGGYLFLQNTDSRHFYSKIAGILSAILVAKSRIGYIHTKVSTEVLEGLVISKGFTKLNHYSYISSFPIVGRLLSADRKFTFNRNFFGTTCAPKRQFFANESLMLFQKVKAA